MPEDPDENQDPVINQVLADAWNMLGFAKESN
jgi:hypothetical protein